MAWEPTGTPGTDLLQTYRGYALAPFTPADIPYAYALATRDPLAWRWRYRSVVPPAAEFERHFFTDVAAAFMVVRQPDQLLGLAVIYSLNLRDQNAYIAIQLSVEAHRTGAGVAAVYLGQRYAFSAWPLRRLYFELPEYNLDQVRSAIDLGLLQVESCLRDYVYFDGTWHDYHTFSVTRDTGARLLAADASTPSRELYTPSTLSGTWVAEVWFSRGEHAVQSLDDRCELDSLQAFELLCALSEIHQHELNPSVLASLETWRDVELFAQQGLRERGIQ